MKTVMFSANQPTIQQGVILIEGLIAILIFSIGILGIVGLQAASIKNTNDAQFRAEAATLANSVISKMRLYDVGAVTTDFASPSGFQYTQWLSDLQAANALLPGMLINNPTIVFNNREITVTIFWQTQSNSNLSQHIVYSQLDQ